MWLLGPGSVVLDRSHTWQVTEGAWAAGGAATPVVSCGLDSKKPLFPLGDWSLLDSDPPRTPLRPSPVGNDVACGVSGKPCSAVGVTCFAPLADVQTPRPMSTTIAGRTTRQPANRDIWTNMPQP